MTNCERTTQERATELNFKFWEALIPLAVVAFMIVHAALGKVSLRLNVTVNHSGWFLIPAKIESTKFGEKAH